MLQNFNYQVNDAKIRVSFLCARKSLTFFKKFFERFRDYSGSVPGGFRVMFGG
jgi:hypothetical protein